MAALCRRHGVPFVVDCAQSAGVLPISLETLQADFIAMPGHKSLLGPQGTGILLCGAIPKPLLQGGTGSNSRDWEMPDFLPDRAEAGTVNVPGIAGLLAGMHYVNQTGVETLFRRGHEQAMRCAAGLKDLGFRVFAGPHQAATVSFLAKADCEEAAAVLAEQGIAVRAGLHCAPLAHESAGTLDSGTVRVSFGHDASSMQTQRLLRACERLR
jgi:selenocysteine lyase/cysteine desulfurase